MDEFWKDLRERISRADNVALFWAIAAGIPLFLVFMAGAVFTWVQLIVYILGLLV